VTVHTWLLLFHIGFAVVWLGGATVMAILALRFQVGRRWDELARLGQDIEWLGLRVFTPVSLVTMALGVALVLETDWSFGTLWIQAALGLYLTSFLIGAGFLGPQSGKVGRLIQEVGAEAPQAQAKISRLLLVFRLDLLVVFSILLMMIWKPV